MTEDKTTRQVEFRFMADSRKCHGYEIHMGQTSTPAPFLTFSNGLQEGCMADNKCFGSYVHGILDNQAVIDFILKPYEKANSQMSFDANKFKNEQYDLLAQWLREHIDIPQIYKILENND
jgi:adenosylcobyric acid synthase